MGLIGLVAQLVDGSLLGLSGMLDTLDARLTQAHAGDLGHLEFLQALCEDEIAQREAAALVRRVHAARFEQTVTLEDFGFNPQVPAATCAATPIPTPMATMIATPITTPPNG